MTSFLEKYIELSNEIISIINEDETDDFIDRVNDLLDKREKICENILLSRVDIDEKDIGIINSCDDEMQEALKIRMKTFNVNLTDINNKRKELLLSKKAHKKYISPYVNDSGYYFDKKK